jgi:DNA-binding winged helix-turn-helix (wHTH) protein/Tol biopolymer transport system component
MVAPSTPDIPDMPDFKVGNYTVLTSRNLVVYQNEETSITPKMLKVLCELAKHQGKTLSKEQLFESAWGTTVTTDMVLSRPIADLRKVFNDSAQKQQVIETVTKQGYRLKATVTWLNEPRQKTKRRTLLSRGLVITTLAALLIAISALVFNTYIAEQDESYAFDGAPILDNLTSDHDRERRVRFSPDGKYILYSKNNKDDQTQRLVLHSLVGKQTVSTIPSSSDDGGYALVAVFSPDSKKVAFREFDGASCRLIILDIKTLIQEFSVQCPGSSISSLDWSPNGEYLITTKLDIKKKKESLLLFELASRQFNELSTPEFDSAGYLFPRYSPDGKSIAVIFLRPTNNLWVIGLIDSATGAFYQVFQSEQKINQVVWGNSDNELFYVLASSARSVIWKMDLLSGKSSHLLNGKMMDLDFNAKTKQFVFTQQKRETSIWKATSINNTMENRESPIIDSTYENSEPRLSPNDQYLAYISTRSGVDSIWVENLNTQKSEQLFKMKNAKIADIVWSPDGKQIVFTLIEKNRSRIIFIGIENKQTKEFARSADTANGKWSPDGQSFYWMEKVSGNWLLNKQEKDSESIEPIFSKPIKYYLPMSNGNIYFQEILSTAIYSYNVITKKPAIEIVNQTSHFGSWDAKDSALFYTAWSNEEQRTYLYREVPASNKSEALFPITIAASAFKDNLTVSEDGSTAYFCKLTKLNYDIILMSY